MFLYFTVSFIKFFHEKGAGKTLVVTVVCSPHSLSAACEKSCHWWTEKVNSNYVNIFSGSSQNLRNESTALGSWKMPDL